MKLFHLSDIHGDFETFDKILGFLKNSDAEIVAITGDLSGEVLPSDEVEYFRQGAESLMQLMPSIYRQSEGKINNIHDLASLITKGNIKFENDQENLERIAKEYLRYGETAEKNMQANYIKFKQRFDWLEKKVFLVPGNWDGMCINDTLGNENIDRRIQEKFNDITFSGYGSAPHISANIPRDLIVPFNEHEAYGHLCSNSDAEIVLTHASLAGFSPNGDGVWSLLAYMNRNTPSLILSGHSHKPLIAKDEKTGTVITNAGNLGKYENQNFGTFLEIDIDKNLFVKPKRIYQVEGNQIKYKEIELGGQK